MEKMAMDEPKHENDKMLSEYRDVNTEKPPSFAENITNYFREYCNSTSIHGFRYFGEQRTIFEKLWWITAFILCLTGLVISIIAVYQKWNNSPVIVTFATKPVPIFHLPFPALTVCSESKLNASAFNFSELVDKNSKGKNLTTRENIPVSLKYSESATSKIRPWIAKMRLTDLNRFCDHALKYLRWDVLNKSTGKTLFQPVLFFKAWCVFDYPHPREKILNYVAAICNDLDRSQFENLPGESFFDIIEEIAPDYYPINCILWGVKQESCGPYFSPMLTDEGLCYSFNILDREEMFKEGLNFYSDFQNVNYSASNWSMEYGYMPDAGLEAYPARALLAGARYAFTFELVTIKDDIVTECKDSVEGYKALLHIPMRVPRMTQQYFRIPLDQIVTVSIRPAMINTSETVKNYPPEKRECYFPSERPLRFYRNYSQINCGFECFANYTLGQCGCVHFSMPHENGTRICGGQDVECMEAAEYMTQIGYLAKKITIHEFSKDQNRDFTKLDCGCLPLCTDIDYNVAISQTNWNWTRKGESNNYKNLSEEKYYRSKVSIYFQSGDFIPSERNELYGPVEFLANFGGLLGLFTGFSVLSFIEITYFLSIRLFCNIRMFGHWWTGNQ